MNKYKKGLLVLRHSSTMCTATTEVVSIANNMGAQVTVPDPDPISNITYIDHNQSMLDIYYFHPDHLGSSSYVTNSAAVVSQHMEYLPFGERLVDEHLNSNNSPFKYNGKEFDEETGNYYYSARYYDPKWSIFISVDPLAEMYIGISAYAFTANNPVKYREIDGRYFEDSDERRAARIERRADNRAEKFERRANRLEAKGKDSGDLQQRADELKQSAQDIRDMRGDKSTQYRYAKVNSKEGKALDLNSGATIGTGIKKNGDKIVTMYTYGDMGNKIHETRHGGQHFRNEIDAFKQEVNIPSEVSAYRAQYSWNGNFSYLNSSVDQTSDFSRTLMNSNDFNFARVDITNINDINSSMVKQIGYIFNFNPDDYSDPRAKNIPKGNYILPLY